MKLLQRISVFLLATLVAVQANAGFLSPDWFEVTHPGVGTNRYTYCNNDPINCTDRNGNAPDHDYGYGSYHGSAYMGSRQDARDHDAASPGMTALDYSQRQIDLRNHMFQSGSRQSLSEDPAVQYQAGINLMMQFGNVSPRHRQAWFVEQFHYGVYAGFSTGHLALATPMGRSMAAAAPLAGTTSQALSRVGRWMSTAEYEMMVKTGRIVPSRSGATHVANPASSTTFGKQAPPGSVYVEFSVPSTSLQASSTGVSTVVTPGSNAAARLERLGRPTPTELPVVSGIRLIDSK